MDINQNTGVIAIVIDSKDMNRPMVKNMPAMLQKLVEAAGINARVVMPEAVHVDEDSNVAMSRNVDYLNDGPEPDEGGLGRLTEDAGCAACSPSGCKPSLLDIVDMAMESSDLLIEQCLVDAAFKKAGVSIAARYTLPGDGAVSQHPIFSREAWVVEANGGDTELGYWNWVNQQVGLVLEEADKRRLAELKCRACG